MELETNQTSIKLRKKTKTTTIILGVILVTIPVCVALFMSMPGLLMALKSSLGEITRGAVIGVSALPVLLFVGIKGGNEWYKKVWCWCVLVLMVIGISLIVFLGNPSSADAGMGMPAGPMEGGSMMGRAVG